MRRTLAYGAAVFLPAALVAQPPLPPLFVTMTANEPLLAAWLSAPAGTSTAFATLPAGALPAPSQVLEAGDGTNPRLRLGCHRQVLSGSIAVLNFEVLSFQPLNEVLVTQADVTFRIAAPPGTVLGIHGIVQSFHGCGDGNAIWVDLDDDGSIDFDSQGGNQRAVTRIAGVTPLAIRVRSNWIAPQTQCSYLCSIEIWPWHPAAQPAGDGCGNVTPPVPPQSGFPAGSTNYQMAARTTFNFVDWVDLVAFGTGDAGFFLFDQQPTMAPVTLPNPWSITCPALANPFAAIPAGMQFGFARLILPFLPPGQVLYVQHAAFSLQPPFRFGTSNRIRLQS